MKNVLVLILLLCSATDAFGSTEASRFAEKQYASKCKHNKAHIVVKKEHTTDYPLILEKSEISAIVYGYGDMKIKGNKKFSISYICLLDKNNKPFWSHVIQTR